MPSTQLLASIADGAASSGAEAVLFWIFAVIALGSAIAVVSMRNIVHAALMLVLNFLCIAALYLGLQSSFLSIVQVIVYAGAIVVLFLFVIMLLGVDRDDLLGTKTPLRAVAAVVAGVALAGALLVVLGDGSLTQASACGAQATEATGPAVECIGLDDVSDDSVSFVGARLFTRWTFAFELASLLLVVATLGALVLGRRKDPAIEDGPTPSGAVPGPSDVETVLAAVEEAAAAEAAEASTATAVAVATPDTDDDPDDEADTDLAAADTPADDAAADDAAALGTPDRPSWLDDGDDDDTDDDGGA